MQTPTPSSYSPRARRAWHRKPLFRFLLLALLVGGGYYAYTKSGSNKPKGPPPVAVRVATATTANVSRNVEAVGTVVPVQSVALKARLDSQVTAVHFKDGDPVKAGDLLFELDAAPLRAQAAQLQANIARDQAQLDNARRQSGRIEALAAKGYATKAQRDDAIAQSKVSQASVAASLAALDSVKAQLGYTRITAPISGRTGTINITVGNTVKANDATPLVTINQMKPIRVQAALPQTLFDDVRNAMRQGRVIIKAYAQNSSTEQQPLAEGTLDYLDNSVNQTTGTFITRASFANEDEPLWPGMFVALVIALGQDQNALTIPEIAVQHSQTGDVVYVIADNLAHKREVTVARLEQGVAVISKGLAAGEVVATDGLLSIKDGAPITIQTTAAATPTDKPAPTPAP